MGNPRGGTELQHEWLIANLPAEVLDKVQIVSRPTELDDNKKRVLWIQDMPADIPFIAEDKGRQLFDAIVFVSAWQQTVFFLNADVPYSEGVVIKNAIDPIEEIDKDKDKVRLVYHPTPHRGLEILVPVFNDLCQHYDNLHLDVFSNFDIYARPELNEHFNDLYEICMNHPNITYHGSQPNHVVRSYLAKAHIFAYPCIWRETSCMSAMEAMTAKCLTVAPNYGALPETLANFNISYNWTDNIKNHSSIFKIKLEEAINAIHSLQMQDHLEMQKQYADKFYNKSTRINEWIEFLTDLTCPKKPISGLFRWIN